MATLSFIQVVDLAMRFYSKIKRSLAQMFPGKVCVWFQRAFDAYKRYARPGSECSDCGALDPVCAHATSSYCIFCGYTAACEQLEALEWTDPRLCDQLLRSKCEWDELVQEFVRHVKLSESQYISELSPGGDRIKISDVKNAGFHVWLPISALGPASLQYHQIMSIFVDGRHMDALRALLLTRWRQDPKLVEQAECEAMACEWSGLACDLCNFESKGPVSHLTSGRSVCQFCVHVEPGEVTSIDNLPCDAYPADTRRETTAKQDANAIFVQLVERCEGSVAWLDSTTARTTGCIIPKVTPGRDYHVITCSQSAWSPIAQTIHTQPQITLWKSRLFFYLKNAVPGSIGCIWMDYCATFYTSKNKSWSPEEDLAYLLTRRLVRDGGYVGITISSRLKGHTRASTHAHIARMIRDSYPSASLVHDISYGTMSTLFFHVCV